MSGRRTNVGLLALLAVAFATGGLAYATGVAWGRWIVLSHGAAGLAILALSPWKSMVIRRGLGRERSGKATSIALAGFVLIAVGVGVAHSAGARRLPLVTSMQLHVAAAVAVLPLAAWHVVARPARPRRTDLSRRSLLRTGALAGGAAGGWLALESVYSLAGLPGAERRFTGSHEVGSGRPSDMPVTQWFDDDVPAIDGAEWMLRTESRTGTKEWSEAELLAVPRRRLVALLDCTGGWYAEQVWEGVPVSLLLRRSDERSLLVKSVTGYSRRFPAGDLDRLMLATHVGDARLSRGHGFPARLVAPGRRGFWWVKWVAELRLEATPWWWQPPFPLT